MMDLFSNYKRWLIIIYKIIIKTIKLLNSPYQIKYFMLKLKTKCDRIFNKVKWLVNKWYGFSI